MIREERSCAKHHVKRGVELAGAHRDPLDVLSMFPSGGPDPAPSDMNYTIVINGFVWIGCMIYYFIFARHWYTGPKMIVAEGRSIDSDNTISAPVDLQQTSNGHKEE